MVLVFHAMTEGVRWQMVPLYVLLGILALMLVWRSVRKRDDPAAAPKRGVLRTIASGVVRHGLLAFSVLFVSFLPVALPVFTLPEPPTWTQVGVSDLLLSFEDRPEILTDDPGDHRELLVRVWYPAKVAAGSEPARYFTAAEARAVTETLRASVPVPSFLNSHATLVKTHSYRAAELLPAEDRYPVLVFSHGYGSYLSQNTSLMEYLASLGYVVFSIAHTYDGAVVFPDGRSPGVGAHFKGWIRQSMETMEQSFDEIQAFVETTDQGARRTMLEGMRRQAAEDRENRLGPGLSWAVWIEDWNRFFDVLEELDSGARPSIFTHRLDLDRIGLFGMSFGGATAAEVCHVHPGCRGAINIDGAHYMGSDSVLYDTESSKPLMMIYASNVTTSPTPSAGNPGDFQALNDFYYESVASRGLRNDVIRVRIDGTSHTHLTDASLMVRYLPGTASRISGTRIAEILDRYCRAFFDHYVQGADVRSPLLDGPASEFPEVSFQTFGHGFDERRPPEPIPTTPETERHEVPAPASPADDPLDGAGRGEVETDPGTLPEPGTEVTGTDPSKCEGIDVAATLNMRGEGAATSCGAIGDGLIALAGARSARGSEIPEPEPSSAVSAYIVRLAVLKTGRVTSIREDVLGPESSEEVRAILREDQGWFVKVGPERLGAQPGVRLGFFTSTGSDYMTDTEIAMLYVLNPTDGTTTLRWIGEGSTYINVMDECEVFMSATFQLKGGTLVRRIRPRVVYTPPTEWPSGIIGGRRGCKAEPGRVDRFRLAPTGR